jgi:protein-L-isoaspartate(D-aspartate) O-methyltransferase
MRPTWIRRQLERRGIDDPRVLDAMERVPREEFVAVTQREIAYTDAPVPLPFGQTVSQPYMVALMCQLLALRGHERVLDVGTGSGYAAAVLCELAAEVHSVERIPELAELARVNLDRNGYERVQVHLGDGSLGLPDEAPFDAIAVAAASSHGIPEALWAELREAGRIVLPLAIRGTEVSAATDQRLCVLQRTPAGPRLLDSIPARFVPLVTAAE